MKVILLGTGTSHGVPMIGCDCEVCTSGDPRDRRTRVSIYVEWKGVHVLVDTSPELRLQCLANDIRRVDAVLFTHHHADHITGLDDLRRFNWLQRTRLCCYAQPDDVRGIGQMFSYAFEDDPDYPSHKPDLEFMPVDGPIELKPTGDGAEESPGVTVIPVPLQHGSTSVLGFRFGRFAYCTDCNFIADDSLEKLADLDVLVLDALRLRPHPTHFNLEQAIDWARRINAGHTYFTHIAHEILHERIDTQLPDNMSLGYDGMVIEMPDE